jgi:purine nucleosidase
VRIEIASELTRGMTVVDRLNVAGDERNRELWKGVPLADICWTLDASRWKKLLYASLLESGPIG